MTYETPNPEITSDDKLWVLLAYIFSPLVPIIVLLMADKKDRPFIKAHNAQALVAGILVAVIGGALSWTCIVPLVLWGAMIYWGYKGYQGEYVNIPIITDFCKNQGW